jgi:diacylglycerol kinase family enzyme
MLAGAPRMSQPWVAIQRNPRSGSGRRRRLLYDLVSELRRHGLRPRLYTRRDRLDERLDVERHRDDLVCIVAAGGDGTVGDLINRFPGVPLALFPLGTENLLARHLGVRACGRTVAAMIAAGQTRRFDLGLIGERRFALMAGFGFDAEIVHRLDARRTGTISHLAYLGPIWDAVRDYRFPEMRFYPDDAADPLTASVAFIVNLPAYAMRLPLAAGADGHDGQFDVRLFRPQSRRELVRDFLQVARGCHESDPRVACFRTTRLRIESDVSVPVQVDGDPAGTTPAEIRMLPSALEVICRP